MYNIIMGIQIIFCWIDQSLEEFIHFKIFFQKGWMENSSMFDEMKKQQQNDEDYDLEWSVHY